MTAAVLMTLVLVAAGAAFVIAPLLRRDALEPEERGRPGVDELRELHARQQMLLASLKDLEDDRATDKIGDDDYERLKTNLSNQAIEVMQRIDAAEAEHDRQVEREAQASRPLQYPGKGRTGGVP
jgi:hypothetical protein